MWFLKMQIKSAMGYHLWNRDFVLKLCICWGFWTGRDEEFSGILMLCWLKYNWNNLLGEPSGNVNQKSLKKDILRLRNSTSEMCLKEISVFSDM